MKFNLTGNGKTGPKLYILSRYSLETLKL